MLGEIRALRSKITNKTFLQLLHAACVHCLEGDDMKYFVSRVIGAHNANVSHHTVREIEELPGAAAVPCMVHHSRPVFLVHRDLYIVRVRSETTILQFICEPVSAVLR